eukprot:6490322-Amphidinium_carterae.1
MGKDSPKKDKKKHSLDGTKNDKLKQQDPGLIVVDKEVEVAPATLIEGGTCADADMHGVSSEVVPVPTTSPDARVDLFSTLALINTKMDTLLKLQASHDQIVSDVSTLKHAFQTMKADVLSQSYKLSSLGPLETQVQGLCEELKQIKTHLDDRQRASPRFAGKGKGDVSSSPADNGVQRKGKGKNSQPTPPPPSATPTTPDSEVDKKVLHFSGFPLPLTHEEFLDFATKSMCLPGSATLKTRAMYTLKMEVHFTSEKEADSFLSAFRQKEIFADSACKHRVYCQPSLPKSLLKNGWKLRVARRELLKAQVPGTIEMQYRSMSLYVDRLLVAYVKQGELLLTQKWPHAASQTALWAALASSG